jgi:hypothetical protein
LYKGLSRAINFGRQCHFKIWLDCHKFKKFPCLIMRMSTKCQKKWKKCQLMSYKMMIGYELWYLRQFYNGTFSIASKNDLDDQNLLLATVSWVILPSFNTYYAGHKILAVTFLTFKKSVNKPLGIVTLLSILVILTINLNCLKLR